MTRAEGQEERGARAAELDARRLAKMARSAHAFVRGNTIQHFDWLDEYQALPPGPPVWICGDCHVGNLGPVADRQGNVAIQIRDLDQTTIGNPAHDLVRLALSLASVARGSDLPGAATAQLMEGMAAGYVAGLHRDDVPDAVAEPVAVATIRRKALGRKWHHLARERLGEVRPAIPLGRKFLQLSDDERWHLGVLLDSPPVKSLVLALNRRSERAKVELVDAAYWVKGCSSLGKLRYAALIHLSGERKDKLSLVDVKEAVASVAPSAADVPTDHAERVVAGARALSPHLGERMAAATLADRPVVVRELLPEDLKLEIAQFTRAEAVTAARYLAAVVGAAHGRQMDADVRASWSREVTGGEAGRLGVPDWLWNPVVALLVRHEAAYLEHCRALAAAAA